MDLCDEYKLSESVGRMAVGQSYAGLRQRATVQSIVERRQRWRSLSTKQQNEECNRLIELASGGDTADITPSDAIRDVAEYILTGFESGLDDMSVLLLPAGPRARSHVSIGPINRAFPYVGGEALMLEGLRNFFPIGVFEVMLTPRTSSWFDARIFKVSFVHPH